MTRTINDWNAAQVKRAESTWGQKIPQYSLDAFTFASKSESYLDLGCGFGRFLGWLLTFKEEPNYIGYDSSTDMISRVRRKFPSYSHMCFEHNITGPISHKQEAILCSAVMIHITLDEQSKVLSNVLSADPERFVFDINSPSESYLLKKDHFERIIPPGFRMTWQSHYTMTRKIMSMFNDYDVSVSFYPLHSNRHKVVYMLKKRD